MGVTSREYTTCMVPFTEGTAAKSSVMITLLYRALYFYGVYKLSNKFGRPSCKIFC